MGPKIVLYIHEDEESEALINNFKRWAMDKNFDWSIESLEVLKLQPGIGVSGEKSSLKQVPDMWVSGQTFQVMENKFSLSNHTKKQKILSMEEVESQVIKEAIQAYEGNLSQVSRKLKIGRATLYRKLKQYNIVAAEWMNGFKKVA